MLKADLHLHSGEDQKDALIKYDAYELIDRAHALGFDVISITNHEDIFFNDKIREYAKRKGIILIPGVEAKIENSHVLIYNISKEQLKKIKKLSDIKRIKSKNNLVIAAHPFYIGISSLKDKLEKYIDIFDAIEYSHFYLKWLNFPNEKAVKIAHKFKKTLVGTSDAHNLWRIGKTYSLIDSKKDINEIIQAIKLGKVKIVSEPLSFFSYIRILVFLLMQAAARYFRKFYKERTQVSHK